jgi:AcrR family transcriptional regulator
MLRIREMELPVVNSGRAERADAARNRRRILAAAERLFSENGVACTSMDAIAVEAGVGKGTLFRRFGDRATLALAVLDESERALQDSILSGPPPLGPGSDPAERLVAFGAAMLDRLELHADLLFEAEVVSGGAWLASEPHAVHRLHIRALVARARPECDADYVADTLLGGLQAQVFVFQRRSREMDLDRLKRGYADLVRQLIG